MQTYIRESKDRSYLIGQGTVYTLQYSPFNKNIKRYITLNRHSGQPIINTRTGYRSDEVVLFTNISDAEIFAELFNSAKERRNSSYQWKVVEHKSSWNNATYLLKPHKYKDKITFYTKHFYADNEDKPIVHFEKENINNNVEYAIECLENLKTTINNFKEEINNIKPKENEAETLQVNDQGLYVEPTYYNDLSELENIQIDLNQVQYVTDENVNIIPITKYADLPFSSAFPVAPLNIYLTPTYITPTIAATFTIIITTPNNLPKRFLYEGSLLLTKNNWVPLVPINIISRMYCHPKKNTQATRSVIKLSLTSAFPSTLPNIYLTPKNIVAIIIRVVPT